jgi:benzoate-CoA ligase
MARWTNACRRMAAGLRALGIKREERVLLLMLDCNDWPVSFLGAMYAGLVPVAVNTLLTADDYAYMLEHSRAQAVLVSGALLPALTAAMVKADHEVAKVIVSRPVAPLHPAEVEFEAFLAAQHRCQAGGHRSGRPRLLAVLVRLHRPPQGHGAHMPTPTGPAELYGKAVLQPARKRCLLLGRQAVLRLRPGQRAEPSDERGRHHAADGRAAHARCGVQALARRPPRAPLGGGAGRPVSGCFAHRLLRRAHRLCRHAGAPEPAGARRRALRLVSSAGEACRPNLGERFTAHFGVDIVDGIGSTEMLHIFLSNRPEKVRYGTTGWPVPGYDIELRGDDGRPGARRRTGDLYIHGPSAAMMYWGNRSKTRETFQGGWTKSGDKYVRNADGSYTYSGRSDDMLKVSGIYVSPFEVEATLVQHPAVLEAAVIGVPDTRA